MQSDFKESDWKILRSMKDTLLNRLCRQILDKHCRAMHFGTTGN